VSRLSRQAALERVKKALSTAQRNKVTIIAPRHSAMLLFGIHKTFLDPGFRQGAGVGVLRDFKVRKLDFCGSDVPAAKNVLIAPRMPLPQISSGAGASEQMPVFNSKNVQL
jgi:hypothetical protein